MPVRVWPRAPYLKINYRPEIDGLRCLAVIAVVFYHAKITFNDNIIFSGGFIGVDIFFVISGYLISTIILKELLETENFSFTYFYERRIRRILPALLFIILCSLPFGWIFLYPIELENFSKSILYTLGFSSNFYFHFSGLEYGSPESILKPFLHTWSLSVEEQYYLIFPIILLLIFTYLRKYLVLLLITSLLTSLFFADWGSKVFPSSTFYFIHTRIWELLCGSLLAYYEIKIGSRSKNRYLNLVFSFIGLSLILLSIFYFDDQIFHPSLITLIPVIGVILVIWFTNEGDIITKTLSNKLFVGVGLISYSFYLWHYVIFSFAKNLDIYFNSNFEKFFLILIAILLSIFTFFCVEQPFRKKISLKTFFLIITSTIFFIVFLNSIIVVNQGFPKRIKVANYQEKHTFKYLTQNGKECFSRNENFCKFGDGKRKIILLGDSHLGSLSFDLKNRIEDKYIFIPITNVSYFHTRNLHLVSKKSKVVNKRYNQLRIKVDEILKNSKNNIIILGGASSLYFYHKRVKDRSLHWEGQFVDKNSLVYNPKFIENDFKNIIKDLSVENEVILIYPIPEIGTNLQTKKFENMVRVYKYLYSDFLYQNKEVIEFYDSLNFPKLQKVYPHKLFCDKDTNICKTHDAENFFFFDGYHPSLEGAKMINNLIIEKVNENNQSR